MAVTINLSDWWDIFSNFLFSKLENNMVCLYKKYKFIIFKIWDSKKLFNNFQKSYCFYKINLIKLFYFYFLKQIKVVNISKQHLMLLVIFWSSLEVITWITVVWYGSIVVAAFVLVFFFFFLFFFPPSLKYICFINTHLKMVQ